MDVTAVAVAQAAGLNYEGSGDKSVGRGCERLWWYADGDVLHGRYGQELMEYEKRTLVTHSEREAFSLGQQIDDSVGVCGTDMRQGRCIVQMTSQESNATVNFPSPASASSLLCSSLGHTS